MVPSVTVINNARQRGYTLVELMVAITLGLLVVAGLVTVFVNNSQARNEIERSNQQIENGRYAMRLLADELRNAGYLAQFDPTPLATPAAKPDPCAIADAAGLAILRTALPIPVQGYDNPKPANPANVPSCLPSIDVKDNTDILVIRRASTCAVGDANCDAVVAGAPYFQASACSSATELSSFVATSYYALDTNTASLTLHKNDCLTAPPGTVAPYQQYRTHIYFIAKNDKSGDGIPTLKRAELGAGGFTIVPLVEGIENMQIEYGIDTAGNTGAPAVFTANPDGYPPPPATPCAGATCVGYWRNTVAAKIYLLVRNTTTSPGYSDSKTYYLGLNANGTDNTAGPFSDGYKRHAYASVVRLNNTAGRLTP